MPRHVAIRTHELTKRFAGEISVDRLTFDVPRGRILGLVGPSGSGKTTTVRLLTGFYRPTSGRAEVLGKEPAQFSREDRGRIGYLTQSPLLYGELTVEANVRFASALYGVSHHVRDRIRSVLDFVELGEHRKKRLVQTSGGMQRRVALAATLVHEPELLFLDEPTAGLDPILRTKLWDHFRGLRAEGRTLVVTTQYVGEAVHCDEVGLMVGGRLVAVDTPSALRRRAMGGDVVRLRTDPPLSSGDCDALLSLPSVVAVRPAPGTSGLTDVVVDDASTAIGAIIALLGQRETSLSSIERHVPPFDEVFVALVGADRDEIADPPTPVVT